MQHVWGRRRSYSVLVWNMREKTPLVSRGHRWEDIIKMYNKPVRREIVDWDHLTEDGYKFL